MERISQLELKEKYIATTHEKLNALSLSLESRERTLLMHENDIISREHILVSREAQFGRREATSYIPNSPQIQDTTMLSATESPYAPKMPQRKSLAHLVAARAISETPRIRQPLIENMDNNRYFKDNLLV
jgi:hypothetical protein